MLPKYLIAAAGALVAAAATSEAQEVPQIAGPCAEICLAAVQPHQQLLCGVPQDVPMGTLTELEGVVQISVPAGLEPAAAQTPIGPGDQLVLQEQGMVQLAGPACNVAIGGPAVLNALPVDNCACLVAEAPTATPGPGEEQFTTFPGGEQFVIPAMLAVPLLVGIIAIDDDDFVPPAPPRPITP